jgi:hypothetical protein
MTTPTGMIDTVALMMADQIGILSAHQQDNGTKEPMFPLLNGPANTMSEIKNISGWPADGYTFDPPPSVAQPQSFVRQTYTEIDNQGATNYNNPKSYKIFVQPIIWMPRYYVPYTDPIPYQSPSQYATYLNGVAQPLADLGGPVETDFSGPYNDVNFGGNLQLVNGVNPQYYLQRYRYNPEFSAMERNAYIFGFGRVRWELYNIINGIYVLKQTSLYNTLAQGPCPKLAWVAQP